MKQEDKELLIKDLCARLPYKCKYKASKDITHWHKLTLSTGTIDKIIDDYYDDIKPYLRPMSSMTEEEREEYNNLYYQVSISVDNNGNTFRDMKILEWLHISWLLKNHFDIYGLIPKGLAIEVTEGNNPYND